MLLSARASAAVDAPVAGAAGSGESQLLRRAARGVRVGCPALPGEPHPPRNACAGCGVQ